MPDALTLLGAYIKERVEFSEEGNLFWKRTNKRAVAGTRAEFMSRNGYKMMGITFAGKRHRLMSHRVIWFLYYESWPVGEIDHINRNRSDNRIGNLRICNRQQNVCRALTKCRLLPRGVCYVPNINKTNPYMAQCGNKYVGYYPTAQKAHEAYLVAHKNRYGEFSDVP